MFWKFWKMSSKSSVMEFLLVNCKYSNYPASSFTMHVFFKILENFWDRRVLWSYFSAKQALASSRQNSFSKELLEKSQDGLRVYLKITPPLVSSNFQLVGKYAKYAKIFGVVLFSKHQRMDASESWNCLFLELQ